MKRKTGLRVCEHIALGATLQEARDQVFAAVVKLHAAYPKTTRQIQQVNTVLASLDKLRCTLDSVSGDENPADQWAPSIYYGAHSEKRVQVVAEILSKHRAGNPECCAEAEEFPTDPRHYRDSCTPCRDEMPYGISSTCTPEHMEPKENAGYLCFYTCPAGHHWTCWYSKTRGYFSDCECSYCQARRDANGDKTYPRPVAYNDEGSAGRLWLAARLAAPLPDGTPTA